MLQLYRKQLNLQDVDGKAFGQALDMWCGKEEAGVEMELDEVREVAGIADIF
jgi:hypothetical protein